MKVQEEVEVLELVLDQEVVDHAALRRTKGAFALVEVVLSRGADLPVKVGAINAQGVRDAGPQALAGLVLTSTPQS